MAADLKDTPRAGLTVQLCGDAHLSNFGVFASPERELLFDLNDFDETLPGPFEYDVERLAASFTIAGRNNGFSKQDVRAATLTVVNAYRMAMAEFAQMGVMDIYYSKLTDEELMIMLRHAVADEDAAAKAARKKQKGKKAGRSAKQTAAQAEGEAPGQRLKRVEKADAKARTRDSLQALSKLGEIVDGEYRIVSQPPIVVPSRELLRHVRDVLRRALARHPPGVPGLPRHAAVRPPAPARAVRGRRHGAQGRRRGQRRHAGVHRAAAGPRRAGPALPAGQGSDAVRAGGPPAEEPAPARIARRPRPADDAGRQRHLPRVDEGLPGGPLSVLAAAPRHEGLGRRGVDASRSASRSTRASAAGRWRARTRGPATRSRSAPTSARATSSTRR